MVNQMDAICPRPVPMGSSVLSRPERWLYRLYYGPFRKGFRKILRPWLRSSIQVRFGPARGMRLPRFEPAYRLGVYELHVQQALKTLLKTGDVFFDIGANIGFYTLIGTRCVGSQGRVWAFEPLTTNCEQIRELMQANPGGNIQLVPMAVGNSVGWVGFKAEGSAAQAALAADGTSQVPITTLDEFIMKAPRPDAVLMDVEGAEVLVLEGSGQLLSSTPPRFWLIEAHSAEILDAIRKFLSARDYSLQVIKPPVERKGGYPRHLLATFNGYVPNKIPGCVSSPARGVTKPVC